MEEMGRRRLLPLVEASHQLGVGRSTVYALIAAGSLEVVKIGRRSLIPAESIEAYVASLRATDDA